MAVTEGSFRVVFKDASGTRRDVVFGEVRTEVLDISTDPRQQLLVPVGQQMLDEDDKMDIELKGDTAGTMDAASTIRIPVRIRNKKTGVTRETYLTATSFGLDTTDVSYGTDWTRVATYTVGAQEQLKLGHSTAPNSRIYVALVVA